MSWGRVKIKKKLFQELLDLLQQLSSQIYQLHLKQKQLDSLFNQDLGHCRKYASCYYYEPGGRQRVQLLNEIHHFCFIHSPGDIFDGWVAWPA